MRGHRLEWRGPGHDSGNATPEPEPTAASPFVTLGIGIVFVFLVLFIGGPIALAMSGGAGALIVFTIGALVAGTVAGGVMPTAVKNRRGFLKTFGTIALVLGLPIAGLGLFFFHAMFTESGGWNPRRPKRCSFR
ncbi:MAG TPA: hypothetical protein DCY13_04445 [Verrucomicrobiales bacterium]|nr:hypothetical protein [Verrucomicrobiales bacterium]